MQNLIRDFRHTVRGLVSRPGYTIVVIATLALVIGAATAVLAVVSATLVRPLPFPHGDRLVQFFLMPPGQSDWPSRNPQSLGTFLRFRQNLKQTELFDGVWARERVLGGDTEPEVVIAGAVSPGLFELFGGTPAMGRTFTEEEDRAGAKVVVLGHGIWQRRFGADASILNKIVLIDRESYEVIGIMPPLFKTGFVETGLWTPLNVTEKDIPSGNTVVQTFARLRAGATIEQLRTEVAPVMKVAMAENPKALTGWSPLVVDFRDAQFRLQRPAVIALAGGVAALFLIACANLTNLVLAQIVSKRSQLALRTALGAGRAALIRLQVIETLLLAATGAIAGLLLGRWVLPVLLGLDPSLARTFGEIRIDWRVQLAAAVAAATVAIVSGLVPLLRELRRNPMMTMATGSHRTTGSRRDRVMRAVLVGSQCALSVVLLACTALLFSAFERTSRMHPGFDPQSVLTAQMRLSAAAYPTEAARADLIERVLDKVRGISGVSSAGATLNRFVPGFFFVTRVFVEDRPAPDGQPYVVQFRRASAGYFPSMRIPVRGRDFASTDRLDQPLVAIVSEQFAEQYWPGGDAIGRRLRRGTSPQFLTIVGIAGDVSDVGYAQPPAATVYIPFSQNNVAITPVSLVVRTSGDPLALAGALRAVVLSIDPQQPIDSVSTLDQFLADSLGPQRFRSTLLLVLGGIGLALAGLGVYGVTSRAVAERTGELGVRLALGAVPSSLARLVVWQSMRVVLAGLGAGIALAIVAAMAMLKLLPDVGRAAPWVTAPAILVLAVVAMFAAIIPARRALGLTASTALKTN